MVAKFLSGAGCDSAEGVEAPCRTTVPGNGDQGPAIRALGGGLSHDHGDGVREEDAEGVSQRAVASLLVCEDEVGAQAPVRQGMTDAQVQQSHGQIDKCAEAARILEAELAQRSAGDLTLQAGTAEDQVGQVGEQCRWTHGATMVAINRLWSGG